MKTMRKDYQVKRVAEKDVKEHLTLGFVFCPKNFLKASKMLKDRNFSKNSK